MDKQKQGMSNDLGTLAEDARALMAATADVAGDRVGEARKRLAAALENGKVIYDRVRETAVEGAWVEVYAPPFERFLRRFETPLADPILQAGIYARRKRLAFDRPPTRSPHARRSTRSLGRCASSSRRSHGVEGDYYAGRVYNDFVRYVSSRKRAAARTGLALRRRAARRLQQHKALGGDEGYAN